MRLELPKDPITLNLTRCKHDFLLPSLPTLYQRPFDEHEPLTIPYGDLMTVIPQLSTRCDGCDSRTEQADTCDAVLSALSDRVQARLKRAPPEAFRFLVVHEGASQAWRDIEVLDCDFVNLHRHLAVAFGFEINQRNKGDCQFDFYFEEENLYILQGIRTPEPYWPATCIRLSDVLTNRQAPVRFTCNIDARGCTYTDGGTQVTFIRRRQKIGDGAFPRLINGRRIPFEPTFPPEVNARYIAKVLFPKNHRDERRTMSLEPFEDLFDLEDTQGQLWGLLG